MLIHAFDPYCNRGTIVLSSLITRKQGRAMRNMQSYYAKQTTKDLKTSRSKKLQQLRTAQQYNTWFAKQDRLRLSRQIEWIDIELESRDLQQPLF